MNVVHHKQPEFHGHFKWNKMVMWILFIAIYFASSSGSEKHGPSCNCSALG